MAKRPVDDDEDDLQKVRKRRYNPKKPAEDDEDGAPSPPSRRGSFDDDEEEDGENSISTGNMYFDIALDFRDDCIDWAKEHILYAIIIGSVSFILFSVSSSLYIHSWVRYLNRPSLEEVDNAYKLGFFPETKLLADEALRYISAADPEKRSGFLFLQGIALCAIAERAVPADQRDYYLMAANYLKESSRYGFMKDRVAEGWFFLGESLFYCEEWEQCRLPIEIALDEHYPFTKEAYWYLAFAYFWGASPDFQRSAEYLHRFQQEPTALEEEIAESHLLGTLLALQTDGIKPAEDIFKKVPHFEQFVMMRNFVEGQIELFKGRDYRLQAIALEKDPNPQLLLDQPVAPVSVEPMEIPQADQSENLHHPAHEFPTAPVPVEPMDESTVRAFMLPDNQSAPLIGMFDNNSGIQQRIAALQSRYAQESSEPADLRRSAPDPVQNDGIVIFPKEDEQSASPSAPEPPPLLEIPIDPLSGDPVLRRVQELRDTAAEHYQRAIALFAEVIRLADSKDSWGRTARLLTGMSYNEMGDVPAAHVVFRNVIETFPTSPESAAASFFIGEYEQARANSEAALRAFTFAFDNIRKNSKYSSFWLPKTLIAEKCSAMIRSDIERQNHDQAISILNTLRDVMPPEVLARLKGETYESWGTLLQSQAETTFGEEGNLMVEDAESKFRSAGDAFNELAQILSVTQEFGNLLWRSAENYRFGKNFRRGILQYRNYIKADVLHHRPEVNLYLGEMYFHLDFLDESVYVLEDALRSFPAHLLVPQIRLVLSHVFYEQKKWDEAKSLLQLNLIGDASPLSASYRDSMYMLGKICFEQSDLESAIAYWEDALKIHPEAVQAAETSYRLAQAYLKQAENRLNELSANSQAAVRQSAESIASNDRRRALSHLEHTEEMLTNRHQALGLNESEQLMLRNAQFLTCSVLMTLEQYEQVIPKLNMLATAYMNQPETLDAMIRMAYALRMSGKNTESQTTLRQAEVILNQLEQAGVIADGTDWRNMIQRQQPQ